MREGIPNHHKVLFPSPPFLHKIHLFPTAFSSNMIMHVEVEEGWDGLHRDADSSQVREVRPFECPREFAERCQVGVFKFEDVNC